MKNTVQSWKNKFYSSLEGSYTESESKTIWRILIEDGLHRDQMSDQVFTNAEQKLLLGFTAELLEERPVQYVVAKALFMERYFKVDESVLIPRPETEELVRYMIDQEQPTEKRVLDIGTGTACIALSLKNHFSNWEITAIDYSEAALEVAKENVIDHAQEVHLLKMDFLDESQWKSLGDFDIIVSNPPYIDTNEASLMEDRVLEYEPKMALFPKGDDPLIFYRKIKEFAKSHLSSEGSIYLELNEFNAQEVHALFAQGDFTSVNLIKDFQNKDRILEVKK